MISGHVRSCFRETKCLIHIKIFYRDAGMRHTGHIVRGDGAANFSKVSSLGRFKLYGKCLLAF